MIFLSPHIFNNRFTVKYFVFDFYPSRKLVLENYNKEAFRQRKENMKRALINIRKFFDA
jgi:hypothetical protein